MNETLINGNKWCHIYKDTDGIDNYHNTETNETYRIIPTISGFGFFIEYYKDAKLIARNTISFEYMKILSLLAGSNDLLYKLTTSYGENNKCLSE